MNRKIHVTREYVLTAALDDADDEELEELQPFEGAWVFGDPSIDRAQLCRAVQELGAVQAALYESELDERELSAVLQRLLESGDLRLWRRRPRRVTAFAPKPGAHEEAPGPSTQQDWIEVEILDPDGNPVPHVVVEVELPNGQTRRQTANENGWLRLDGIPSGNCKVRFPQWDQDSWRPA